MKPTNISFTKKSLIEPSIFVGIAFFAGSTRLIQYFPGATKGGLLLTGGLVGAACALHDYTSDGNEFSARKKTAFLGLGLISAFAITQSLKGRVTLSLTDTLKIVFMGGTITLLKNWFEHSLSKKAESKPTETPTTPKPTEASLTTDKLLRPIDEKKNKIRILAGKNIGCTICRNGEDPTRGKITLLDEVYEAKNKKGEAGLLMRSEDFNTIKNVCHQGAFDICYDKVKGGSLAEYGFQAVGNHEFMFLRKIPADLKKIDTYVTDKTVQYSENSVGTYLLASDLDPNIEPNAEKDILQDLKQTHGEKIRTMFSDDGIPDVHHLFIPKDKTQVPGISTAIFFNNFNKPKAITEEWNRVKTFLMELKNIGFRAYSCNNQQHMVIIGAYQDKLITPEDLANLFRDNETVRNQFFNALKNAATEKAYSGENMKEQVKLWMDAYIRRFQTV